MKKLIGLFFCCILFSSCSLPSGVYNNRDIFEEGKNTARLFNIRIMRWGDLRFSGLLALQYRQNGLYYIVLDATGVKLIEAEVASAGDHMLIRAVGPLKTSQLPNYLSTSLKRIYLLEPLQRPCSQEFLRSFCREPLPEHGWRKYMKSGPFTAWEVRKGGVRGEKKDSFVYSQPWIGMRIVLEERKELSGK